MVGREISPHFKALINLGSDVRPHAVVAVKGYDSATNRRTVRDRGAIPVRPNTRAIPKVFGKALVAQGAVGKLDTRINLVAFAGM
jgi:hypothetical protein